MLMPSQTLPKELESTVLIRFHDCDPFGHLNNTHYINYFMDARLDQVATAYDLNILERVHTDNENWFVTKTQIQYLLPARFNEQVRIRTCLIGFTERVTTIEGQMISFDGTRLLAMVWTDFMFVDTITGHPKRHSLELMDFFRVICVDRVYDPQGFGARVKEAKRELRHAPVGHKP